jgi:hypothetical protein
LTPPMQAWHSVGRAKETFSFRSETLTIQVEKKQIDVPMDM